MKLRNGFVSNSSSSSFLIIGQEGKDAAAGNMAVEDDSGCIRGFGMWGDEYGSNEVTLAQLRGWIAKAESLYGADTKVWFGVKGDG